MLQTSTSVGYSQFNADTLYIIIQFLGIQQNIPQLLALSHTSTHFHKLIHEEMIETIWEPLFEQLVHPHNNIFIFEHKSLYQGLQSRMLLYGIDRTVISKLALLQSKALQTTCKQDFTEKSVLQIQQEEEQIKSLMLQECKTHFWKRRFPIFISIAVVLCLLILFCVLLGGKLVLDSLHVGFEIPSSVVLSPIYLLCFGLHLVITLFLFHHMHSYKNIFFSKEKSPWRRILSMQHLSIMIVSLLLYAMFILFPLFTVLGIHIQLLFSISYSLFLAPMILFVMFWILIATCLGVVSCCLTKANHPWNWFHLHRSCCVKKEEEEEQAEEEELSKQRLRFILLNVCMASPFLPSIFVLLLSCYLYSPSTIPLLVVFSPLICLDAIVSLFFLFMACPHMCIYVWNILVKQQWKSLHRHSEEQQQQQQLKQTPSASLFVLFGLGMFIICCLNILWKIAFSFVVWFIPQTDSNFGIYTCITICIPLLCCLVLPLLFIGLVIRCEMKHQYTLHAQLLSLFVPNKYVLWI